MVLAIANSLNWNYKDTKARTIRTPKIETLTPITGKGPPFFSYAHQPYMPWTNIQQLLYLPTVYSYTAECATGVLCVSVCVCVYVESARDLTPYRNEVLTQIINRFTHICGRGRTHTKAHY